MIAVPDEASAESAPPPPTSHLVPGAGAQIHLLDYGDPGHPPIVMVHGIRDLARSLEVVARPLAGTYRVLALDLRGHGDSEKTGSYSQPLYVADLHEVIANLELDDVILIGHSLGGQVVCRYAALFPEHVRAVISIEGLGPPTWPNDAGEDGRRRVARARVEMLAQLRAAGRVMRDLDEATERVAHKHPKLDAERARDLAAHGTVEVDGGISWKWDPRVQSTWASVTREDNEQHWQWVECPTLVVTAGLAGDFWRQRRGMKEAPRGGLTPDELARRLAFFSRATHVEIGDSGHMVHFDAPDELNTHIAAFLERV
ncbi:MAG: alpha/beta hydrolase [Acidobacteriota bacterium]|nr:alpha/beta hydrolase [Acidobacteriota bacterium]